jgi:hypothetical protein
MMRPSYQRSNMSLLQKLRDTARKGEKVFHEIWTYELGRT